MSGHAVPEGYFALRQSAAWRVLSGRGKIRMLGEDRARLLHALTTNNIQQLTPGQGCYAFFLTAQGRILADVNVLCRPDSLLLDTEPETAAKVYQHLDKFIIADDVVLEDETTRLTSLAIEGPHAAEVLTKLGAPLPEAAFGNQPWRDSLVARLSYTGSSGFHVIGDAAQTAELEQMLLDSGIASASSEAFDLVRLEHGQPRYGVDLSERFLAQEANQPQALNFNKGCYLGQEIVERVRSRGQIHRVLTPLEIDTTEVPQPGTKIQESGSNVAEITSAAFSPALDKVVALAYVRTDRAQPGTLLHLDQVVVRVGHSHDGA